MRNPGHSRLARAALFAAGAALLPAPAARAYFATPPGAPAIEVLALQELDAFVEANPVLGGWLEGVREQIEAGKKQEEEGARRLGEEQPEPEREGERERRRRGHAELTLGSDEALARRAEIRRGGGAMSELRGMLGASDAVVTDAGKPQEIDPAELLAKVDLKKLKKAERAKLVIPVIAREKAAPSLQQLYQEHLQKAYFGGGGNTPTSTAEAGYIRRGIDDLNWGSFPTAAHGAVPPGAAATWSGGHITMAPGLVDLRIFDHEWIHHSDAANGDGSPIGENENSEVEGKTSYGNMGCVVGLGSANGC